MSTVRRSPTVRAALAALLVLGAILVAAGSAQAQSPATRACSDYLTQETAQWFFESVGGPSQDPYGLDEDRDGIACEELPCPCTFTKLTDPAPAVPAVPARSATPAAKVVRARVLRVIDARTLRVRVRAPSPRTAVVRLLGIDVPSRARRECGSSQATAALSRLARRGTIVVLRPDPARSGIDRARRLVAYVTNARGKLLQTEMLRRGWAKLAARPRQLARYRGLASAHRSARKARRGVWRACGGKFHRKAKRS